MTVRHWSFAVAALAAVLSVAGPARADRAAAAATPATDAAGPPHAEFMAMLRDDLGPAFRSAPDSVGRAASIRQFIRNRFDLDQIAVVTLGDHWATASAEERAGFRTALSRHMAKMMARMLGSGTVEVEAAPRIRTVGELRYATVVLRTVNGRVPCMFVLTSDRAGQRIADVVIYGISLVTVKQAEFRSILERGGFSGLIAALEQ